MADVRLHGLFREEEPLADLAIDEAVRDQLEDFDLASCWILSDFAGRRRREGDDCPTAARAAPSRSRFEASAVVPVTVQDLPSLSGVHEFRIGVVHVPL